MKIWNRQRRDPSIGIRKQIDEEGRIEEVTPPAPLDHAWYREHFKMDGNRLGLKELEALLPDPIDPEELAEAVDAGIVGVEYDRSYDEQLWLNRSP